MKIVLCSVPGEPVHFDLTNKVRGLGNLPVLPKFGITALAQWMWKNGYKRDELDFYDMDMLLPSDDEIRAYFQSSKPDIVGLSAVTSGTYGRVKKYARIIRSACPDTMMVLGGNLAASANIVLKKTDVDICVAGDGEIAWVKLLDYTKKHGRTIDPGVLGDIKGLAFLNAAGEFSFTGFGEKLPASDMSLVPDYDLLKKGLQDQPELLKNYFRPARESHWFNHDPRAHESGRKPNIAMLMVNKGCVARCTFCQRPTKGFRAGNVPELEEHVLYLKNNHDVGFISVSDENFGSDKKQAFEFAAIMKKHDMLWAATGVRCDTVTPESIKFYADNNCVALKFGIESGSQDILDLMEKKFKREQVINAVKWCRDRKIFSPLAILFGMPGETEETAKETGKLMAEIALATHSHPAEGKDLMYAIPFPGTPLYEYGQQVGVIGSTVDDEEDYLENVFTAPSYKLSYVNLNGAPVSELLFWDLLAQLEAMRYYLKETGRRNNGAQTSAYAAHEVESIIFKPTPVFGNESIRDIIIRKIKTRKWKTSFYPFASLFIQRKIIPSPLAARVPRILLYPIIKLLLLLEYYVILLYKRREAFSYYRFISPKQKVKRIGEDYRRSILSKKPVPSKKVISLRSIVMENRKPPASLSEANRIELLTGL
ncbi:MAG: B12-binding domain-containing radical SAM protein [Betaproteobacteria bacterium]|nr:B12-binding domain-containing radical SAM protein [Betaproteobacteria bacterium]